MLKFFRPLGIADPSQDAVPGLTDVPNKSFSGDGPLLKELEGWCKKVLLACRHYGLPFDPKAVFQVASQDPFRQRYGLYIHDSDLLNGILRRAEEDGKTADLKERWNRQKAEEEGMTADSKERGMEHHVELPEATFGVLFLNRATVYHPGPDDAHGIVGNDSNRFLITDFYWLTLFDESGVPFCNIINSTVLPFYYDPHLRTRLDGALEFFPEPDELIFTWHELAAMLGLHRSAIYAAACISQAGWKRKAFGKMVTKASWKELPRIDSANSSTGTHHWIDLDDALISRVAAPTYDYPSLEVAPLDAFAVADLVANAHTADKEIVPREVDVSGEMILSADLKGQWTELDVLPFPELRSGTEAEAAILKLFASRMKSASNVAYLGRGVFSVRTAQLLKLAAGNQHWGSAGEWETASIKAIIETAEKVGTAGAFVASASGLALASWGWHRGEEARTLKDAKWAQCTDLSEAECIECFNTVLQSYNDAITYGASGAASGAAGAGIAAILMAIGPFGWLLLGIIGLGVLAAGIGTATVIDGFFSKEDIYQACAKEPSEILVSL